MQHKAKKTLATAVQIPIITTLKYEPYYANLKHIKPPSIKDKLNNYNINIKNPLCYKFIEELTQNIMINCQSNKQELFKKDLDFSFPSLILLDYILNFMSIDIK
jgi:hypothetical protein